MWLTWVSRTAFAIDDREVGDRHRGVKEARTHTSWCPPASPTRLSRRELAVLRFARFHPPVSPTRRSLMKA